MPKNKSPRKVLKEWQSLPSKTRTGRLAKIYAAKCGMRSMAEVEIAVLIQDCRRRYKYEPEAWEYQFIPAPKYTPDFKIKDVYFEVKGKMTADTRRKMKAIRLTYPERKIAMIFVRGVNKLSSGSKTTYNKWAENMGYIVFDLSNAESREKLHQFIKDI